MIELCSLVKSSRKKALPLQCIYFFQHKQNSQHIKLYSKLKLGYFPILQPGHFRVYSTDNHPDNLPHLMQNHKCLSKSLNEIHKKINNISWGRMSVK